MLQLIDRILLRCDRTRTFTYRYTNLKGRFTSQNHDPQPVRDLRKSYRSQNNSFQVVLAQIAPGGVSTGLSMWLKAENEFTYYNSTDAVWMDQSSNRYTLSANLVLGSDGLSAPTLTSNSINYNPGITFDGSDTGLSTGTDVTGFGYTEWTAFSVQTITQPLARHSYWLDSWLFSGSSRYS